MKSKMPCPPGFVPVAKVDHATGVCAGVVVATRENAPSAQPLEVRQFSRGEHCLDDRRLKPVKPDHDHLIQGHALQG